MGILAGIMISIGCILYLQIGGVAGACLFAVGLASVCFFNFKLFTGQAGKLMTREIAPLALFRIWIENLFGTFIMSSLVIFAHPKAEEIAAASQKIVESRSAAGIESCFLLAIPCGILMYCAVSARDNLRLIYIIMCVAAFILGGFYHCVADMFYALTGARTWGHLMNVFVVTAGNIVGCNIVPFFKKIEEKAQNYF